MLLYPFLLRAIWDVTDPFLLSAVTSLGTEYLFCFCPHSLISVTSPSLPVSSPYPWICPLRSSSSVLSFEVTEGKPNTPLASNQDAVPHRRRKEEEEAQEKKKKKKEGSLADTMPKMILLAPKICPRLVQIVMVSVQHWEYLSAANAYKRISQCRRPTTGPRASPISHFPLPVATHLLDGLSFVFCLVHRPSSSGPLSTVPSDIRALHRLSWV